MANGEGWVGNIQGITTIKDADGEDLQRRKALKFKCEVGDDGTVSIIFPSAPVGVTGANDAAALDSLVAALVTLGLITDERS